MRKIFLSLALALSCIAASAQLDSTKIAVFEGMLKEYYAALEHESEEVKEAEVDFIIESCTDSLLRQRVAVSVYDHYVNSPLMGEEAVAIHVYDRWFASKKVRMYNDLDFLNAGIFADFNRNSLLGMDAPQLTLETIDGSVVTLPSQGRRSLLYFYDTDCSRCKMESILLKYVLEGEDQFQLDFYAVYVGSNEEAWHEYVQNQLNVKSPTVNVFHVWDPEIESDFQRLYGLLQTPRMFLTDKNGVIIGRRLTSEALKEILILGVAADKLQEKCPVGTDLSAEKYAGLLKKGNKSKDGVFSLKKADYVVFYTEGCGGCEAQLKAIEGREGKFLLVNVDQLLADDFEKSRELFQKYDLSVLPYILKLKKGKVQDRYISFTSR